MASFLFFSLLPTKLQILLFWGCCSQRVSNSAAILAITMFYIGYVGGAGSQYMSKLSGVSLIEIPWKPKEKITESVSELATGLKS